jgi:hypothetical protein
MTQSLTLSNAGTADFDAGLRDPQALSGTGVHAVDLSWTASASSGVTENNVYRSNASDGPYSLLSATPGHRNLACRFGCYCRVDLLLRDHRDMHQGVESVYPNVVSATIPTP